jgi:hypothetical protein
MPSRSDEEAPAGRHVTSRALKLVRIWIAIVALFVLASLSTAAGGGDEGETVLVKEYRRKDGAKVKPRDRNDPGRRTAGPAMSSMTLLA